MDHQKGVLAVLGRHVIRVTVHVLTRNRQLGEVLKHVPTNLGQVLGVVGADVEHGGVVLCGKSVQPHGKNRQLAGAPAGFVQTLLVSVETGGRGRIDITNVLGITVVRAAPVVGLNIGVVITTRFEIAEHLLGCVPQVDAQVIDQLQLALRIKLSVERHLGVGRAAPNQRSTGVIAHAPKHGGANTRRTDHRMGLAAQRFEHLFQLVQC